MKNIFYVFLLYNLFLANLFAAVVTDGTRTGTRFGNWLNSGNTIQISVTLTGTHASTGATPLTNRDAHVIVCFSASANFTDWEAMDDIGVAEQRLDASDYQEFSITHADLYRVEDQVPNSGPPPAAYTYMKFAIFIDRYNYNEDGTTPGNDFDPLDVTDLIPVLFEDPDPPNGDEPYCEYTSPLFDVAKNVHCSCFLCEGE